MDDKQLRDCTPEEVAEQLADYVNGHSNRDFREVATALSRREHRTLQQKVCGLMLACIKQWGSLSEREHDLRNQWTVDMCREIVDHIGEYNFTPPLI